MAFGTVKVDTLTSSTQTLSVDDLVTLAQTTANFTGTLQNGGSNVVVDSDIGSSVQAYDANLPAGNTILVDGDVGSVVQAYDANLPAGNTILVDGDVGSVVQAYDADTAKTDVAQTFTAQQTFGEIKEGVHTLATTGTIALDPANGSVQVSVLTGNPSFTDSLESGQSIVLHLEAGASNTVTWPTGTIWTTAAGNAAPTLTAKDVVVFWKVSSALYAAYVGSYV
jgi:microcompartment protein CcmL/EutN|tara:strand:- start:4602 stop:5273 length:672 start_codon:yes stop_codon:yes gene_type:complete